MAGYEHKPQRGSIFNKAKEKTEDWHKDYGGSALIDGKLYFVDGYIDKKKDGEKYLSLKFRPQNELKTPAKEPEEKKPVELNDEIPF